MACHHQIQCPCCGQVHAVNIPARYKRIRRVHRKGRRLVLNYVGVVRRLVGQIQCRCPNTWQLYHIVCERAPR